MRVLSLIAEAKIHAAIEAGELDDLPGAGSPLPDDGLGRVPAELRMGYKLLRNAGCLPPELEARKEVARLGELVATAGDPGERARLSRLQAEADLRYRLLIERRRG